SPTSIAPPAVRTLVIRAGDPANHWRAAAAETAQTLSPATATAAKVRPRATTCGAAGCPGATNWGRSAARKTSVFGLVTPVAKPATRALAPWEPPGAAAATGTS